MSALSFRSGRFRSAPVVLPLAAVLLAVGAGICFWRALPASRLASPPAPSRSPLDRRPDSAAARIQQAEAYCRAGETFAGIVQLEIARTLDARQESVSLRLAQLYSALGEFEQVARVLDAARSGPQTSEELCAALSQARLKLGDFDGAAAAIQPLLPRWERLSNNSKRVFVRTLLLAGETARAGRLLARGGTDAEWMALRGLHAMLRNQPQVAAQRLMISRRRDPEDVWSAYLLGLAYRRAGRPQEALAAWMRAVQMPDAPGRARIGAAGLLAQSGRLTDAQALLRRVESADQDDPAYWEAWNRIARQEKQTVQEGITRGYAAFHRGDPWRAEAIWRALLPQAQGEDARELYAAIHNSAFRRQDMDIAFRYASEATARWPRDPYLLRRRAELLLGQNRLPQALAQAEQLQKIAPPDQEAEVTELLSRIALDAGKPELLEQSARRHLALKPSDPDPLLHLAEWQGQLGRSPDNLERTLQLYREAIASDPRSAEAQARAGLLLAELDRPQEAVRTLLQALTLSPRTLDGAPHAQLAQLYQRQGSEPEREFHAAQYLRLRQRQEGWPSLLKALRQDRPLQDWKALGAKALERHETWIALCAFTRCVRLAPGDPASWQGLAAAQKRLGRFEEALYAMQRVRQLKPQRS